MPKRTSTTLSLLNPSPDPQALTVRVLRPTGAALEQTVTVPARRPLTVTLASWLGATANVPEFALEVQWPVGATGAATVVVNNASALPIITLPPFVSCVVP